MYNGSIIIIIIPYEGGLKAAKPKPGGVLGYGAVGIVLSCRQRSDWHLKRAAVATLRVPLAHRSHVREHRQWEYES
ncbi:hypothetical protein ACLKA7_002729 [Drosophila subpalustris]